MKDDELIQTPFGKKRWGFLKRCMEMHESLDLPWMLKVVRLAMKQLDDYGLAASPLRRAHGGLERVEEALAFASHEARTKEGE